MLSVPAKRGCREAYGNPARDGPPPSRRRVMPYPMYSGNVSYPSDCEVFAGNMQLRRPQAANAHMLMHPHAALRDEYEYYEYGDEGYFDGECMYKGEEVFVEYDMPVYRVREGRARRAAPRSMPAYVRHIQ